MGALLMLGTHPSFDGGMIECKATQIGTARITVKKAVLARTASFLARWDASLSSLAFDRNSSDRDRSSCESLGRLASDVTFIPLSPSEKC
jgi:hypothetical protein